MIVSKKAQSMVEFTVLLVIIIAVFVAMNQYIKRGIQGRWKSSIDDFGEQYDPRLTNALMNYKIVSNSATQIQTMQDQGGYWTRRIDSANSTTTTNSLSTVGATF